MTSLSLLAGRTVGVSHGDIFPLISGGMNPMSMNPMSGGSMFSGLTG